jgi:lysophospholipase L1-like esterase
MTLAVPSGTRVLFVGDSITDGQRLATDQPLGYGYPLHVAAQWGLRHPGRSVTWVNRGIAGNTVADLEVRWQADVLDEDPDLVSVLVGVNDVSCHTWDPPRSPVSVQEYAAGYERLLAPLSARGTRLLLIEPFLLPTTETQREWRHPLTGMIEAVRVLARRHGARLLAADGMFAALASAAPVERWTYDGIHPTAAGHAALAEAWLRLVE